MRLNNSQHTVVQSRHRRTLVLAGAGTGKTATSVHWVADIIKNGTPRSGVLMITFTRKAAQEMAQRTEALIKDVPKQHPRERLWAGTYHAIASLLLRKEADKFGLISNSFTTVDEGEAQSVWKSALKQCGHNAKSPIFQPGKLHERLSLARNTNKSINAIMAAAFGESRVSEVMRVVRNYEELKRAANVVDYDDLLVLWADRMEREPEYAEELRARWPYVLVDEMQDNNQLNQRLLDALDPQHLLVVGDANQSIYGFRGSDVTLILDFPRKHPDAQIYKLEDNYRSGQPILDLANEVVAKNDAALELRSRRKDYHANIEYRMYLAPQDEANGIVAWIKERVDGGAKPNQISILSRSSKALTAVEIALNFHKIRYKKYGGQSIADAAEVKDFLSFLRVAHNPHDKIALLRALTQFPGIGEGTAAKAIAARDDGLFAEGVWPRAAAGLPDWSRSIKEAGSLGEAGRFLENEIRPLILHNYPKDGEERLGTLSALVNSMDKLEGNLVDFLDGFTLDRNLDNYHPHDCVVLSTIHSAKGLEWDHTWLINVSNLAMPHPRATDQAEIAEERRLFYVAVTRAKHELILSFPSTNEKHQGQAASEFVPKSAEWQYCRPPKPENGAQIVKAPAGFG